jgi:hypothetical protein
MVLVPFQFADRLASSRMPASEPVPTPMKWANRWVFWDEDDERDAAARRVCWSAGALMD